MADQLLFGPFSLALFFTYNHLVEEGGFAGLAERFKTDFSNALKSSYKLWPFVQFVNFYLIPLSYRLIFVNIFAVGWSAYLSNLNAKSGSARHCHSVAVVEDTKLVDCY